VYRARDTRLERTVAIKILPTHVSADTVRKQKSAGSAGCIHPTMHAVRQGPSSRAQSLGSGVPRRDVGHCGV